MGDTARVLVRVTGTVQGVGYRPFVYRLAASLELAGSVRNDSDGVLVDATGSPAALADLCRRLRDEAPPLARVDEVRPAEVPVGQRPAGFAIEPSADTGIADVPVSADSGTCAACLAEVDDPADRRYRYPFANCTDCGPRYTIVERVPYDRPATTMRGFPLCPDCRREYDDPSDRRFHAQPVACPACGPRLALVAPDGTDLRPGDVVGAAVRLLLQGRVLAVKGLGGYHLAADATSASAVGSLRVRKARDDKPFAVMVAGVGAAAALVEVDDAAALALASPRRPIVLARRRPGAPVADGVAPGAPELGVMLPYTPLHHLLLAGVGRPLVLTSGNRSDDPIAHLDDDAVTRLGPMVDALVTHDRPIHIRCDDSVVRAGGWGPVGLQVLRRSRGYAPEPIALPFAAGRPVLAVGAELKSTVAVAKGRSVVASHHIGDLEHLEAYRSFLQAVDHLRHLCGVSPELVVHDLHPEYLSTKAALEWDVPALGVQHHHAHVASCLVDHGRTEPVVGLAFDGLGMGDDGTLWGGEVLVADLDGYRRAGHLLAVPLPGGAAASREPWRMAVAWVLASLGPSVAASVGGRLDPRAGALVGVLEGVAGSAAGAGAAGAGAGAGVLPVTSSVGRLFDAVAALVTGRARVTYEGQAAIELEALALRCPVEVAGYPVEVGVGAEGGAGGVVVDPRPLVAAVVGDLGAGRSPAEVAAAFHRGVAVAAASAAVAVAGSAGLGTVALTGGVFQNALLTRLVASRCHEAGLDVLVHRGVPPNDGGISIGQAAIGAHLAG